MGPRSCGWPQGAEQPRSPHSVQRKARAVSECHQEHHAGYTYESDAAGALSAASMILSLAWGFLSAIRQTSEWPAAPWETELLA
jgi:hypothetical protein